MFKITELFAREILIELALKPCGMRRIGIAIANNIAQTRNSEQ